MSGAAISAQRSVNLTSVIRSRIANPQSFIGHSSRTKSWCSELKTSPRATNSPSADYSTNFLCIPSHQLSTVFPNSSFLTIISPHLTDQWHSDETFREAPPMGTILRSTITPQLGGNTMFAGMTAAFEGLKDEMQRLVSTLEGVFDFEPFRTLFGSDPDNKKRLREIEDKYPIRVHPESGRKSIFVNLQFTIGIKGMKDSESTALLTMPFDLSKVPEYQFRHQWQPNTLVIWDNRCVLHYAIHDYYPQHRRMERATIASDQPFGMDAPS